MDKPPPSKDAATFFSIICVHNISGHAPNFVPWHGSLIIRTGHMQTHSLALSYRKPANSPQNGLEHCFRQYDYREFKWSNSSTPSQPDKATLRCLHDTLKSFKHWFSYSVRLKILLMGSNTTLIDTLNWTNKNIGMHVLVLRSMGMANRLHTAGFMGLCFF